MVPNTFARKEKVSPDPAIVSEMRVVIPPIYYREQVVDGKSVSMTMAFKWRGRNFGMSYPITDEEGASDMRKGILRDKLWVIMKQTLDVMVHHGTEALDISGNIDPRKVEDLEAIRFKYDQTWDKKVAAFNALVRVMPITLQKAVRLGLLDKPVA